MRVPAAVRDELRGEPRVGTTGEPAFLFLTADADGAPRVCLLSRAQLAADDDGVRAVVYSTGTQANLERAGLACLVVVCGGAAHYCTLSVRRRVSAGSLSAYALDVRDCRRDEVPGAELSGMRYTVTEQMPSDEDWATTSRLLADLLD